MSAHLADLFDDPLQAASSISYGLFKETDPELLRGLIVADAMRLFQADAVRLYEVSPAFELQPVAQSGRIALPTSALTLEPVLAERAMETHTSLLSTHRRLDADLVPLADACRRDAAMLQAMVIRAHGETLGVAVVHWVGREWPSFKQRRAAYLFWDNVGLAVAIANERGRAERELIRLRQLAFHDELTGLPNTHLLMPELERRLRHGPPVTLLYIDFDGMREANNSPLGYEAGGDHLIRLVGEAIPRFVGGDELVARLHRAGDEFACVLRPGEDGRARAVRLEAELDALELPESHRSFYGGASVGYAVSLADDAAGALLARAAKSMHARKRERRSPDDGA